MRTYFCVILTTIILLNTCQAAPTVPGGFVINKIMDRIDGQTPRLEAIRNPEYGFGVIAATADNGILTVLKVSQSSIETVATKSGYPNLSAARTVCFDTTGLYENKLYISVNFDSDGDQNLEKADILQVLENGTINTKATRGSGSDILDFYFDFTSGEQGYLPGAYLEDGHGGNGTSLYHMGIDYTLTCLKQHWLPAGRTDIDVTQIKFDPTGLYGHYLTMTDTDINTDDWTVIYQLLPDLSWRELTAKVRTSVRQYGDMCFNSAGSFGPMLYVTERISDTVMTVDPNGIHETFASGFNAIESITIDETGEFMYVSDHDGIWQIRIETLEPGPQLIMQEPKVPHDDVFTGESGISSVRFLWNEEIQFMNDDVKILNESGNSVLSSVSGSGSQFMIVAFGNTLLNNKYTITIKDTVTSVETSNLIDGDKDGYAGGDAVIVLEHRQRHDSDNDNDIDLLDLAELAEKWLWVKE